jgi:hypothetical protein
MPQPGSQSDPRNCWSSSGSALTDVCLLFKSTWLPKFADRVIDRIRDYHLVDPIVQWVG